MEQLNGTIYLHGFESRGSTVIPASKIEGLVFSFEKGGEAR